jgi:hypothetical protein
MDGSRRDDAPLGSMHRLTPSLAFGSVIAAAATWLGTRDLESYEHSFFSLDRGTAARAVEVLGHPVYTLALGLGVRLPLHGSLGASPAAALSQYLPAPLTYWCLLAVSIAAAVLLARHSFEPICGRLLSWVATILAFCSPAFVNYTIYSDWPETAVTYCAFVACVCAPHALLALLDAPRSRTQQVLVSTCVAGIVWSLIGASHPGYWPLLALALVLTSLLALLRAEYALRTRLGVLALLAAVSVIAMALQAPDILRELSVAGRYASDMRRFVQGPEGSFVSANAFPFGAIAARSPFTYLLLALVSLPVGCAAADPHTRRLTIGAALVAVALSVAAGTLPPGESFFMPSTTWALRDPAIVFAVLAGASATRVLLGWRAAAPTLRSRLAWTALLLAAVQGPLYAVALIDKGVPAWRSHDSWTHDVEAPAARAIKRGFGGESLSRRGRLAMWPGLREQMRIARRPGVDFADAGYPLVTAWTKQRTMRELVEPNALLFNQNTDLSPAVLCDAQAMAFLQVRYLLMPGGAKCAPWNPLPDVVVDGSLQVGVRPTFDETGWIVSREIAERVRDQPALSPRSALLASVVPAAGTSVHIGATDLTVDISELSTLSGHAMVLPLAYDSAWQSSSGQIRDIGGLAALFDVADAQVRLRYATDTVALLRALSMTLAQVAGVVGLVGFAFVRGVAAEGVRLPIARLAPYTSMVMPHVHSTGRALAAVALPLRQPRNLLFLAYAVAVIARSNWTALLLPAGAIVVARIGRWRRWHEVVGMTMFAVAILVTVRRGSLSAEAVNDPLFWAVVAVAALTASALMRRWPVVALPASVVAGLCATIGALLPMGDAGSFVLLSNRLGLAATALLFAVCLGAILIAGGRGQSDGRTGAAARGALIAALALAVIGVVPGGRGAAAWFGALGVVVGLAEAVPSQRRAKQGNPSVPNVPVG